VPTSPDPRDPSPQRLLFNAVRRSERAAARDRGRRNGRAKADRCLANYQRAIQRALAAGRPVFAFRDCGWVEDVLDGRIMHSEEFGEFAGGMPAGAVGIAFVRADGEVIWQQGMCTNLAAVNEVA